MRLYASKPDSGVLRTESLLKQSQGMVEDVVVVVVVVVRPSNSTFSVDFDSRGRFGSETDTFPLHPTPAAASGRAIRSADEGGPGQSTGISPGQTCVYVRITASKPTRGELESSTSTSTSERVEHDPDTSHSTTKLGSRRIVSRSPTHNVRLKNCPRTSHFIGQGSGSGTASSRSWMGRKDGCG
jgi:hypothetical protein